MRPPDVQNREREWAALEALWRSPRPQLGFVLGRRRVGKSFVLSRFASAVGGVYYQATRRAETEQIAQLTRVLADRFDEPALRHGAAFPSWEHLFDYVGEKAANEPVLLVLDEFPYLTAAAPALPSILQSAWDHGWQDRPVKVVLCGSFVSAMRALEQADQPLYGRRTHRLLFGPFDLADAAGFLPSYDAYERLTAYGVFGNLPGHLALIDPARSLADNAADALLNPVGPLADDAQHMLDAFVADARVHYAIIEAIAAGEQTWSGITRRVARSGGALLRPLRWLEEMGLVTRVVPLTEKSPQRSKRALYRIADPYVSLWHRHVAPLIHTGSLGLVEGRRLWSESLAPRLPEHLGPVFEETCRQHVRRGQGLPFAPMRVGEWWDARGEAQVDVLAVGAQDELFAGECKLGAIGREDLATLRKRASRVAAELGSVSAIHLGLFSARNEADASVRAAVDAGEVLWFDAGDVAGQARSGA